MESRDPEIFRSHHIQFSDLQRRRHLKNFSVLETESGDFRLSPAYDLINTKLHVDDRIFALDKGLLKDNAAESMPYGMTNSTTFREFGKRLGAPRQNYPTGTRQILHLLSAFRYADRQLLFIR